MTVLANENCSLIKLTDDAASVAILTDDETGYREEVDLFHDWRTHNTLFLNITKTNEMVMDFRKRTSLNPVMINVTPIEAVVEYKYLGSIIYSKLKWTVGSANCWEPS